ncbi:hypothetical protein KTT66_05880 [Lacticaseibacillus casei]|uniref:DUF2273 domain-containing protein n=1 Tax=Lacticaseibacillus huelsenbergensis TaxID=3035291 RepID=A0ABY8DT84_9LACO|nr:MULTISPECIES: hypothetical protein [Lacticaseibacillus]MDG3062778.1 hypothetical protein [Lacticaseibacillus sp. BCRC 81376]QVI38509.1 hypothetical protein KGS74_06100 [Lacticaseibacillus casei]QXG60321.1 hypothetical protein KTT66_05880 [Lacticaseibacillus casei]WFB38198.1 hypothetical protein LHUE1_001673 [Lacticaseibacillus huelsenbergensis]WFB42623.1 hypothetical protein LHUE2_000625 [Lacticaseibacillus huelsenbergensis]
MMMYPYINLGPRDGVLLIAAIMLLVLTLVFKWSVFEFVLSAIAVIIAFLAGSMKSDKKNVLTFIKK